MGFAVGRGEFPVRAQMRAAVLKGVPGVVQALNAVVGWNQTGNFFAHFPAGLAAEQMRAFGMNGGSKFTQNFPLRFRFADVAGDFWAEQDAALRAPLGAAALPFLTRLGRGQ